MQRWKPNRPRTDVLTTSKGSPNSPQRNPGAAIPSRSSNIAASNSARADAGKLDRHVIWRPRSELRPFPRNPRQHPERQIQKLMRALCRYWTVPILIDDSGTILCGHARFEASGRLGIEQVPTISIFGLSETDKRAIVIADNKLAEEAVWDVKELRPHFETLLELDFDVELTGFSTGEVDLIIDGQNPQGEQPTDDPMPLDRGAAVTKVNDEWELGPHRILCGDALKAENYARLLKDEAAQMIVADPPYNVKISSVVRRDKLAPREFIQASGELSQAAFAEFLAKFVAHAIHHASDGAIHFIFMDWRHLPELLAAALPQYDEWKNLLVWNKDNAGQGSFYRSKHELIAAFKSGTAAHINNFGLGAQGRHRANVLDYPSVNSFHPARRGDRKLHPTTKPVALIADLIRDCSRRNGVILDPFGGSGTTLIAAERTGRRARLIELDPLYVDVAIRRWQRLTNTEGLHVGTGRSFNELAALRVQR